MCVRFTEATRMAKSLDLWAAVVSLVLGENDMQPHEICAFAYNSLLTTDLFVRT